MAKETIKEMLEMIDAKIEHIEDISADNRAIIVKLVKQSNTIVQFLRNLELQVDEEYGIEAPPSFDCLLYTSPSPRDRTTSRMPSSA